MEGAYASANEAALEGQRIGPLQLRVAILCGFAQMFDGYDVSSIGMAAPSLSHAWNVAPAAFATAFVMSNVGVMVGALASGPTGHRLGRQPGILTSLLLLGRWPAIDRARNRRRARPWRASAPRCRSRS